MGELFLFQGPWHMTHRRHRAGVICLCELCDDSGARTPASHIILVKIYINEEKLTHGKVVLRWNAKLQRLQMCSGCIYRLLRNYYISSCLCVYSRSELHHNIVSNVLFFSLSVSHSDRLVSLQDCCSQETWGSGGKPKLCPSLHQVTLSTPV